MNIITALLPTRNEMVFYSAFLLGAMLPGLADWLWVKLVFVGMF